MEAVKKGISNTPGRVYNDAMEALDWFTNDGNGVIFGTGGGVFFGSERGVFCCWVS